MKDSTKVNLDSLSTLINERNNSINKYNETANEAIDSLEFLLANFGYTIKTMIVMFVLLLSLKYVFETIEFYFDKSKFIRKSEDLRDTVIDNSSILTILLIVSGIILGFIYLDLNFGILFMFFIFSLWSIWLFKIDYIEEPRTNNEIIISLMFWVFALVVFIPMIYLISTQIFMIFSEGFTLIILFKIIGYYLLAILMFYFLSFLIAILNSLILAKLNKK